MLIAAKAFIAAVISGLAAASANHVSGSKVDILTDIMATIVAFNATYFVPNKKATNTPTNTSS